jgi:aminoglycoside phosphotransferase (APT) family kinase protein
LQSDCKPSGFVHNDLKWDNILVHPSEGETEPTEVKIIDWEMAGIGDPCWDVGTVLSEFVAFWALSIPVVDGEPYEGLAKYPIEDMQPAIRAFWDGYSGAMEFDRATARERLLKSVRFAGARLIQTAYERTQTMTHLTPHIYLLLQLSLNIMERPEDAAEGLFGIALPDRASA